MASNYARVIGDLYSDDANGQDAIGAGLKAVLKALAAKDTSAAVSGLNYATDVLNKVASYFDGGPVTTEILAPLQDLSDRRQQGR